MGLLARKPNVQSLTRREDVDGLVEAASYRELSGTSSEPARDLGVPVRVEAILALGGFDAEAGLEAVTAALRDPADRVRCAAVRVLFARTEASVLVEALRWLPADKGQSRTFALRAVHGLRESVTPAALGDALIHNEDDELLNEDELPLIHALVEDRPAEAADELIQLLVSSLEDERGIVADRAGELLLRLAPASTEALAAELRGGPAAAEAAYILGRIADPQTLGALVEALGHDDARVRAESVSALAELRDPVAVKPLLDATHDADHAVRTQAGLALERFGTAAVIFGVAALLEPMILEAVSSAGHGRGGADGRPPSGRRKPRSRRSNGGPPELADPGSIQEPPAA
jgi:HEAT repeat protein